MQKNNGKFHQKERKVRVLLNISGDNIFEFYENDVFFFNRQV